MQVFIETKRLILRELLPTDAKGMFKLDSDPLVHQYLGNKPVTNIQESHDVIAMIRQQYAELGIGRWAVIEKETGNFIGWSGLKLITTTVNNHSDFYDIGYRLIRQYWGNGYATESAMAVMQYGLHQMQLKTIYGMADIDNAASNHVLQKIGLKFVEQFNYDGIACNWYKS
jgi:ribosomal-protein-alanine N-acetyltransferase